MPIQFEVQKDAKGHGYCDHANKEFPYRELEHPTGFADVDGFKICYSPWERVQTGEKSVRVMGIVKSGPYSTSNGEAVSVDPVTDPVLRSKVIEALKELGAVRF